MDIPFQISVLKQLKLTELESLRLPIGFFGGRISLSCTIKSAAEMNSTADETQTLDLKL